MTKIFGVNEWRRRMGLKVLSVFGLKWIEILRHYVQTKMHSEKQLIPKWHLSNHLLAPNVTLSGYKADFNNHNQDIPNFVLGRMWAHLCDPHTDGKLQRIYWEYKEAPRKSSS